VISAQALPFTLLIVLVEFTVGGLWVLWAAHVRGQSAASFVKFGAGMVGVMAVLTFWLAAKLTVDEEVNGYPLDPSYMPGARVALALVAILSLPYALLTIRESRRPSLVAGGAASLAGLAAVGFLAQVFALPTWGYVGTLLAFVVGGLVVGAVSMGMVLGHWYLVTPRLPEAPLVRISRWLAVALAVQLGLFVAWLGFGAGPAGAPAFAALVGPWALFVWLRLLVGLVFPLVVSWAAVQTARTRSMESATGLLYINVGTIAAGTILAAGLYFGAGLLV